MSSIEIFRGDDPVTVSINDLKLTQTISGGVVIRTDVIPQQAFIMVKQQPKGPTSVFQTPLITSTSEDHRKREVREEIGGLLGIPCQIGQNGSVSPPELSELIQLAISELGYKPTQEALEIFAQAGLGLVVKN